jgi:hypothetical protein
MVDETVEALEDLKKFQAGYVTGWYPKDLVEANAVAEGSKKDFLAAASKVRGDRQTPVDRAISHLLVAYSRTPNGSVANCDPGAWYRGQPELSSLLHGPVADLFSIPASSVNSESAFSVAKQRLPSSRGSLSTASTCREVLTALRFQQPSSKVVRPTRVTIPVLYRELTKEQKDMVWSPAVSYDEKGMPILPKPTEKVIEVDAMEDEGEGAVAEKKLPKPPGKEAFDAADRGEGEDGIAPVFPPDPDFDQGWILVEDDLDEEANDLEEALGDRGDANTRYTASELLKEATDALLDEEL